MAFVPAPNILLVEVRATKALQHIENRFHINCFHAPTLSDIEDINAILVTQLGSLWAPNLPTDVSINSVFYRSLQTENSIQLEVPFVPGIAGTHIGIPGPNQNTYCVSLRTGSAGRSARGRLYWLGLSEAQYAVNEIEAVSGPAIVGAVESLRASIQASGRGMSIVSYFNAGVPRPGGPVYFLVTNVLATRSTLSSQRRRMPGYGT